MAAPPRYSLAAAAAVPVLYFGALIAAGVAFPGYDSLTQQPSELGAVGAPRPWIYNGGMAAAGVAFLVGGRGLGRALLVLGGRRGFGTATAVFAAGAGAYLIGIALFPLPDPRHYAIGPLGLAVHPLPFLLAAALWTRPDWRRPRRYLVITGITMIALLAVILGARPDLIGGRPGLWSRIYALAAFPWLAGAAIALHRRLARPSGSL